MTEQLVSWYRLEEKDSILTPYVEYSAADMRFIPIEKPSNVKVPDGYDKVSMDLGHGALTTYQSFQLDKRQRRQPVDIRSRCSGNYWSIRRQCHFAYKLHKCDKDCGYLLYKRNQRSRQYCSSSGK